LNVENIGSGMLGKIPCWAKLVSILSNNTIIKVSAGY